MVLPQDLEDSTLAEVAVASATKVLELASARYEGGVAGVLYLITAELVLLASERVAAQRAGQCLLNPVFLIKALGGDREGPRKAAQEQSSKLGQILNASSVSGANNSAALTWRLERPWAWW